MPIADRTGLVVAVRGHDLEQQHAQTSAEHMYSCVVGPYCHEDNAERCEIAHQSHLLRQCEVIARWYSFAFLPDRVARVLVVWVALAEHAK